MPSPPTPGSSQSAMNTLPSGATQTSEGRNQLRLLLPVVVVVGDEHGAEAVDARLVLVAEVVGDKLQVLAVEVAAPDGPRPAVGGVAPPDSPLAVGGPQPVYARVADAEVELVVR